MSNWYIIDVHACVYTTCAIMADNLINGHILFIWLMDGFVLLDAPIIDLYHFSHELLITIILMLWPIHWYTFLILDHVLINCLIYTSLSEQWFGKHDDWSIMPATISCSWYFHILLNILGLFHLFFAAYVKARDSDFRKIGIIEQLEMETSLQIHPRTIYFLMISVAVLLCNTELSIGSSVSFLPLHFCNFFVFRVKIQNIFQSLSKFLVLS